MLKTTLKRVRQRKTLGERKYSRLHRWKGTTPEEMQNFVPCIT